MPRCGTGAGPERASRSVSYSWCVASLGVVGQAEATALPFRPSRIAAGRPRQAYCGRASASARSVSVPARRLRAPTLGGEKAREVAYDDVHYYADAAARLSEKVARVKKVTGQKTSEIDTFSPDSGVDGARRARHVGRRAVSRRVGFKAATLRRALGSRVPAMPVVLQTALGTEGLAV